VAEPAERQERPSDPAQAFADEHERLADERERLADERERLADEQERLADERERLADHEERIADRAEADVDDPAESAREQLLRAEARVNRALAEQERARAMVGRLVLRDDRERSSAARAEAEGLASALEGDELGWARERRAFVAADRDRLADDRDKAADARDDVARHRDQESDQRDRVARRREEVASRRANDAIGTAASLDRATDHARRELAAVREKARRQRAASGQSRARAAFGRAQHERRNAEARLVEPESPRLAAQLAALSRELFASEDPLAVAERLVELAVECVPGAIASGATLFAEMRVTMQVTTDDVAKQLDAYQIARRDGPIAESVELGKCVWVGDLSIDERWPSFRAMAAELGVRGVGACELAVRRGHVWESLGALTVYAERPGVFDQYAGDALSLFATHLAVVAALDRDRRDLSRREEALHRALGSRDVIGQAKGILMERQRIPAGEAFDILRRTSQRLNIRLQEVAARLAETGDLPA
jgi:hypothetical protein